MKRQMPGSDGVLIEVMLSAFSLVPVVIWSEELSEMKHSVISNLACCRCSSSLACSYARASSSYVEEALSVETMLLRPLSETKDRDAKGKTENLKFKG